VLTPAIGPGSAGTPPATVTARLFEKILPQDWEGVTLIVPELPFGFTVIVLVVEVPVHPDGVIQLNVAPSMAGVVYVKFPELLQITEEPESKPEKFSLLNAK
jgi:hypothetical protein